MKKFVTGTVAALGLFALASTAHAVSLPTLGGPLDNNTSFDVGVNSGGGSSSISFDVYGYSSLDGVNCCTDVFTLSLNGVDIFSGSYNLGGGGDNVTFLNPFGLSIAGLNPDPTFYGFGGVANITVSGLLNLAAGANTIKFAFSGAAQGLGDEGWGIKNLDVSAVPLPPAALLLVTGILGLAGVRRKKTKA